MALTKIEFEIEVEDTFPNGTKIDKESIYSLLAEKAEEEYIAQFEANKLVRRFSFRVKDEPLELSEEIVEEAEVAKIPPNLLSATTGGIRRR